MKQINVIVDLQFGSTGKGLLAGYLAETTKPDTVITAWAANAGHTYINADGRKFVHTMLANGIVSPNLRSRYCLLVFSAKQRQIGARVQPRADLFSQRCFQQMP